MATERYLIPFPCPEKWKREAIGAYQQYVAERESDISNGIQPSTDRLHSWTEFLFEYLEAELEAAD